MLATITLKLFTILSGLLQDLLPIIILAAGLHILHQETRSTVGQASKNRRVRPWLTFFSTRGITQITAIKLQLLEAVSHTRGILPSCIQMICSRTWQDGSPGDSTKRYAAVCRNYLRNYLALTC